jgi:hypothetical protein
MPDIPHDSGARQEEPDSKQRIRALATPFSRNAMVPDEEGGLIVKGVPLLAEGTWTDSAIGTPLHYPSSTLREYAGNWNDTTVWSRHLGGAPRDITDKVGEVISPRFEDNAIIGDIRLHGHTQKSRDVIELVRRKLVSFVSVEHGGSEVYNPETKQMDAKSLVFGGLAVVNRGACKLCRINEEGKPEDCPPEVEVAVPDETPRENEEEDSMENKELEEKIAEIQARYEAQIKELEAKIPVPDDTVVKALEARIKELENQPAPAVTAPAPEQEKELGEVETFVSFDRRDKIARRV